MNILCELRLCCYPINHMSNSGSERIQQFIDGLNKFFEFNKDNVFDVLITDNTISDNNKLPQEILDIIPEKCKIITCLNNNYGCINKGSGVIEQWNYNKNFINKYEWLIYFEPRQLLQTNNLINSFLENPRNLFTMGAENNHFNTGLFCIKIKTLLDYINEVSPKSLVDKTEGIEYSIYNYFIRNNIDFDTRNKMELIWNDVMNIHNPFRMM